MALKTKAVRYNPISYRLERDGKLVALALQLANGRWQINDLRDQRIDALGTFSTPKSAADSYEQEFYA